MNRRKLVASIVSLGLICSTGHMATAAPKNEEPQRAIAVAETVKETSKVEYTDREVLQLLLAAEGRIAQEHPELQQILGFSPENPTVDMDVLNNTIDLYLEETPSVP